MGYITAWIVIYIAGACLCGTVWYALRRFRYFSLLAMGLCAIWLLVPWPIDEQGHTAPLSIVIPFRLFLEHDADASSAVGFAIPVSALLIAGYLGIHAFRLYYRRRL